ncbi:hypothetical protein OHS18_46800 [Amycolatopsis sp. NBC_00355]|uniref:hypothetical protein n=1 Tax=Amycolatopsis sp. NBC_00355 TaxID=2975957 RepID=UPI002E25EE8C
MTVRMHIDLDKVHLIVDGRRHRASLSSAPAPGEEIDMFCGLTDSVSFTTAPEQLVRTCWPCDLHYRRALGLAIPPTHHNSSGRER